MAGSSRPFLCLFLGALRSWGRGFVLIRRFLWPYLRCTVRAPYRNNRIFGKGPFCSYAFYVLVLFEYPLKWRTEGAYEEEEDVGGVIRGSRRTFLFVLHSDHPHSKPKVSNFLLKRYTDRRRGGGYPPTHPHSAVKYKIFNNKIKIKLTAEGVCRTSYKIFLVQGGPPCTLDLKFCRMFCIPLLRSI